MKLSDYIADWLVAQGCSQVFGVTGGSVVHLLHSAEKHKGLHVTYNHHEQASAFAATAASRVSNNIPAVCMVTTGPGGTNAITGLTSAFLDSIPTIFLSGQARSNDARALARVRQSGSQHINIVDVVKPLANHAETLASLEDTKSFFERAERALYSSRPGPIWLDIPLDYQWAEVAEHSFSKFICSPLKSVNKLPREVASAIEHSKRPLFILGYGCRLANIEKKIIEKLDNYSIPYVLTWNSLDFSGYESPMNLGLIGISGTREANLAVKYSDTIIAVGSHLSKMLTGDNLSQFAESAQAIHILDIDDIEFNRFKDDSRFHCHQIDLRDLDVDSFLSTESSTSNRCSFLSEIKNLRKYKIHECCEEAISSTDVNQYVAYEILSKCLRPHDNIVIDGGGNVLFSALQSLELPSNTRLITGAGIGCMGSGLPEAIGAFTANGNRTFCFIGDGSMQFNIQELQTIYHHQCSIIVILYNNSGYLAIKNTQDSFFDRRFGVGAESGLSFPDYSKVCAAYSIRHESVRTKDDYEKLERILSSYKEGPLVIEIHIPESTPLIPRGGFYKDDNGNNVRRPPWQLYPDLESIPSLPNF